MATLLTTLTFARAQALTDSNGLTDTNGIVYANEALFDFHRQLATHGVDASQLQETYCDAIVPSAGNGTTLAYPTDMLALKTIEVNYTDTVGQNYIQATQLDVANMPGGVSFSWLRTNGSTLTPKFDDRGDWYEIFPAFTSANNTSQAIRLFYYLKPTEYTATSDTIAYPESLDYRILGWRIAASYYYSLGKMNEGEKFQNMYQEKVTQYIQTLGRGSQQPIQVAPLEITGWEF